MQFLSAAPRKAGAEVVVGQQHPDRHHVSVGVGVLIVGQYPCARSQRLLSEGSLPLKSLGPRTFGTSGSIPHGTIHELKRYSPNLVEEGFSEVGMQDLA